MFFSSWEGIIRILVVGTLAYLALVVMVRIAGKRTLSKLNAFDFVMTVALGSTLATVLLSSEVPLVDGVVGFGVLVGAQYVISYFSVRSQQFRQLVKSTPRLLLFRGEVLHDALRDERITIEELKQVARQSGRASLEDVAAIVLETDASLSVLSSAPEAGSGTLGNVRG